MDGDSEARKVSGSLEPMRMVLVMTRNEVMTIVVIVVAVIFVTFRQSLQISPR